MPNAKLTNAQLAEIVETQRETVKLIQRRISRMADQLSLIAEDTEKFKNSVSRDIEHLSKRIR